MPSSTLTYYGTRTYGIYNSSGTNVPHSETIVRRTVYRYRSPIVKTAAHAKRKKEPHIWLPPTAMVAQIVDTDYGTGYSRGFGNFWIGTGPLGHPPPDMSMFDSLNTDLESVAITRARLKLKEQDVNYPQAFAERSQVARLVASSAKKVAGMYHYLRKGNFRAAADALGVDVRHGRKAKFDRKALKTNSRALGDAVLELNYGWKPLLQDVHGAANDCAQLDKSYPDRNHVTVRATVTQSEETGVYTGYSPNNPASSWVGTLRRSGSRSVRVRLDYRVDNPFLATLSSTGFLNPAYLAWELLPWSFVADWFIPIGNYLSSWDADLGYSFLGGSCTRRNEGYGELYSTKPYGYNVVGPYNGSHGEAKSVYKKLVDRKVYSSSPVPRFPGFKNPISLTHAANALALLRGSVR